MRKIEGNWFKATVTNVITTVTQYYRRVWKRIKHIKRKTIPVFQRRGAWQLDKRTSKLNKWTNERTNRSKTLGEEVRKILCIFMIVTVILPPLDHTTLHTRLEVGCWPQNTNNGSIKSQRYTAHHISTDTFSSTHTHSWNVSVCVLYKNEKKNVTDNVLEAKKGKFCVHVNSILQCNLLETWKTYAAAARANGSSLSVETVRPLSVIDFQFAMKWQTTKNHLPIITMTKENNKSPEQDRNGNY